jgi:thymidylate kinase
MSDFDAAAAGRSPSRRAGRGLSVALVGPDGAGKSTIAREVARRLPLPAGYLYMGVNLEASHVMLPTTRLALALKRRRGGGSDMTARHPGAQSRGPLATARSLVRIVNWMAEEAYRQVLARRIRRRGAIAVLDRDFFCDYYASAVAEPSTGRPLDVRLHGYVLRRWYRRPDLTIMLDAPAEVLHARKGQDSIEGLERRRQEYLSLASILPAFRTVDATRPLDDVTDEVVAFIVAFAGDLRAADARGAVAVAPTVETDLVGPAGTAEPAVEPAGALVGATTLLDDGGIPVGS